MMSSAKNYFVNGGLPGAEFPQVKMKNECRSSGVNFVDLNAKRADTACRDGRDSTWGVYPKRLTLLGASVGSGQESSVYNQR